METSNQNTENQEPILKGTPVSKGIAEGTVKIVKESMDPSGFNEGDILVATVTDPSMVLMMNKASAIITDTGGITSHAAIVSRELGVPCIVNTKTGTQSLKNGMKVKVDGTKGEIYLTENSSKETETKDYPKWIDNAAKSFQHAMTNMTPSDWGPFDYQTFLQAIDGNFISKLHQAVKTVKEKGYDKETQAKAMHNISTLRVGIWYYLIEYSGITNKEPLKEKLKEINEFFIELLEYMTENDTWGYQENTIHNKDEIKKILEKTEWQPQNKNHTREIGKLYNSLSALSYAFYRDYFPMISHEVYGSYNASEKFGENHTLIIKHFTNLSPTDLWPEIKENHYKEIKILQVYKNINFKTELIGMHSIYDGNPMEDLVSYTVLINNQPVTDIEEIKKIANYLGELATEQYKIYNNMSTQDLKEKTLEWLCYIFSKFFKLAKMDWHPTQEMIKALEGKEILDRCVLEGFPNYEEYINDKKYEIYWLKKLYINPPNYSI
jgi:phosphohistidine swiveling domain-containing protein